MIATHSGPQSRADAPALRFLLLCLGGWVAVRVLTGLNPAVPLPTDGAQPHWQLPDPFAMAPSPPSAASPPVTLAASTMLPTAYPAARADIKALRGTGPGPDPATAALLGGDRHSLRLALMARLLPPLPNGATRAALANGGSSWARVKDMARAEPAGGNAFWMQRQLTKWSLGGWVYLREGSSLAPDGIAAASQLGGSQAGMRLAYGFGDSGRLRAYGRATIAMQQLQQREVALGAAFAPVARWPVDVAVEQRIAVGRDGRTALAAMVAGGVSDVGLPGGFRLEAYAQTGVVGARRRDGFVDGAVAVDRRLGGGNRRSLHLGAFAAGAAQPGAARVDVGPRLTLRLPDVGDGSRIALDWRQRIAGDARPDSGLALTLAADF